MHKHFSSLLVAMLLVPVAFCWGQQPDSLFTTPFVEPLAKDSVSVPQAKARMEELKDKTAYYFPGDYSFHYLSYENQKMIDGLRFSKAISRGAKRGAIVGVCLSSILAFKMVSSDGRVLVFIPAGLIAGALAGSAVSALIYTENVGEREIANINNLINRYNAMAAKRVNKP